jgi:osmotically-inducible protein OsmY
VVKDERLVGIVTRSDLVRAFTRTDDEVERELTEGVLDRTMWIDRDRVHVAVRNGSVELTGLLRRRSDVELLIRLAGQVPGVVSVDSTVRWEVDDVSRKGRRTLERQAG